MVRFGIRNLLKDVALFLVVSLLELLIRARPAQIPSPVSRVLVLSYSGIGNLILGTVVFKPLKTAFPHATIDVLLPQAVQQEIIRNGSLGDIYILPKSFLQKLRLLARLRKRRYDVVLCLFPSGIFGALTAFLLGAPCRIGHPFHKGFGRLSSAFYSHPVQLERKHDTLSNTDLLIPLGIEVRQPALDFQLSSDATRNADAFLRKHGLKNAVGMHPGSNADQAWKRWDIDRFLALADALKKRGHSVLFFLGSGEEELAQPILDAGYLCFRGQTLERTAALMRRCTLFVSNDSALAHVAASQKVKTFAIIGPTDERRTGPVNGVVVRLPLWCAPCYSIYKPFNCINKKYLACLRELEVSQVIDAIVHHD
ncbi:glycosyltransferase family 9 protein [Candidatus Woesearchaeota archaeon]|nr:glycosyltransferase family 9 protein [Candidatus Woesearchaeota archaeon]